MNTYLFAWNPENWGWVNIEQDIEQIKFFGKTKEEHKWRVVSHKKIRPGDRIFVMRLGEEPKGIMASGYVSTEPVLLEGAHFVKIDFDEIINPSSGSLLCLDALQNSEILSKVKKWTPQGSGIEIKASGVDSKKLVDELEKEWFKVLSAQDSRDNPFEEDQRLFPEGTPNQALGTRYERNPHARKVCINHYGVTCIVCGFNFENVYGELGKDFIHVHHLKQVSSVGKEYNINPVKDLRPVCPNCHAMIHRKKEQYSIKEIKERIQNN